MNPSTETAEPAAGPLVSICIPTYNRAGMVGDAIRSALAQTYRNREVIVVDNASTDDTAGVVSSFTDPRLRYVRNDRNLGLFGNCNRCIELAQGKYIHILHSDDRIPPGFTAACTRFLEEHPEVAFTFTPAVVVTGSSRQTVGCPGGDQVFSPPEGFRRILQERSLIPCPSVTVRKEVYRTAGTFSLEFPYSSDLHLWMRIARLHPIACVAGTHVDYRQGEHSESFRLLFDSPLGYLDMLKIYIQVIRELGDRVSQFRPDLNLALGRLSGDCVYAMLTRSQAMKGGTPLALAGIALSTLSLIRPVTLRDLLGKIWLGAVILGGLLVSSIPGVRGAVARALSRNHPLY